MRHITIAVAPRQIDLVAVPCDEAGQGRQHVAQHVRARTGSADDDDVRGHHATPSSKARHSGSRRSALNSRSHRATARSRIATSVSGRVASSTRTRRIMSISSWRSILPMPSLTIMVARLLSASTIASTGSPGRQVGGGLRRVGVADHTGRKTHQAKVGRLHQSVRFCSRAMRQASAPAHAARAGRLTSRMRSVFTAPSPISTNSSRSSAWSSTTLPGSRYRDLETVPRLPAKTSAELCRRAAAGCRPRVGRSRAVEVA